MTTVTKSSLKCIRKLGRFNLDYKSAGNAFRCRTCDRKIIEQNAEHNLIDGSPAYLFGRMKRKLEKTLNKIISIVK
ncbi:MAG: hypothetical protein MJ237_08265 [bacterium]|nr:hypothetical protein [bacterium]